MPERSASSSIRRAFAASLALHAMAGAWLIHRVTEPRTTTAPTPLTVSFKPASALPSVLPRSLLPGSQPPIRTAPGARRLPSDRRQTSPARAADHAAPLESFSEPAATERPVQVAAPMLAPSAGAEPAAPAPVSGPQFNAAYLNNPAPDYPPAARRRRQQGTVLLAVRVGADGRPLSVEISRSSGISELDAAARLAVRGWTFVPARRGGDAIEGSVEVPIRFRLDH